MIASMATISALAARYSIELGRCSATIIDVALKHARTPGGECLGCLHDHTGERTVNGTRQQWVAKTPTSSCSGLPRRIHGVGTHL